jgi:Thymidylate synthase complementing protein
MIKVKIIKDSYNKDLKSRLTTFELVYPRFIHGELMTHRMFSRNAASSRAIPIDKVIELLQTNPAMPVHWGKNQAGMQANVEIDNIEGAKQLWLAARDSAISHAIVMRDMGLHKQIVNRVLEPYQLMKTIVTATEFNNWFWLRAHPDAQPEIKELAEKMLQVYEQSTPQELFEDEWHVPYVSTQRSRYTGELFYVDENDKYISANTARMISASCCAQVSYRKNDGSLEKAQVVFDRLINSVPVHASPVEHIATPITNKMMLGLCDKNIEIEGMTHVGENGQPWSGNLRGWVQYRQLIDNNVKEG